MAKRGGFPGGMGMPGNMNNLMKQAQKMQKQMEESQKELEEKVAFSFWSALDEEHTVIRFVPSWATRMEDVEELVAIL